MPKNGILYASVTCVEPWNYSIFDKPLQWEPVRPQKWSPSLIKYAKRQNWSQNEQNWSRFENTELIKAGL